MQIGFVGLGKMGGNMVHRIRRDSAHEVVAFDFDAAAVKRAVKSGASGAGSLKQLVKQLKTPRVVWIMVPAGDPTQQTVDKLAKLLEPGDMIVDGGNSKWTDDKRRAKALKKRGLDYVDVGVSGGVWGLEVGYCMMVGGPAKAVRRLAPILDVLAPETNEQSRAAIGPRGWLRLGGAGAGHYVKMVHNGVEYGLMQAYAEGFEVMEKSEFDLDLHDIAGYVDDSGEGRWTIFEAINEDVPVPVISAALYARFASRQNESFAAKIDAALRQQFGGHAVKAAAVESPTHGR